MHEVANRLKRFTKFDIYHGMIKFELNGRHSLGTFYCINACEGLQSSFFLVGSCEVVGYDGCCQFGTCIGNTTDCFCDEKCFTLGDCCSDIHKIGCNKSENVPTTASLCTA